VVDNVQSVTEPGFIVVDLRGLHKTQVWIAKKIIDPEANDQMEQSFLVFKHLVKQRGSQYLRHAQLFGHLIFEVLA
jgi:hypothetical protein